MTRLFNRLKTFSSRNRSFSCNYEKPFMFGPMFSSLFFGGLYTYMILGTIIGSNDNVKYIIDQNIKIEKELKELKELVEKNK